MDDHVATGDHNLISWPGFFFFLLAEHGSCLVKVQVVAVELVTAHANTHTHTVVKYKRSYYSNHQWVRPPAKSGREWTTKIISHENILGCKCKKKKKVCVISYI